MLTTEFAAKWAKVDLPERAASQEHFLDICHLLSQETPAKADPKGEWFTFEKGGFAKANLAGYGSPMMTRRPRFELRFEGKAGRLCS